MHVRRAGFLLCVAVPLAALDLVVKASIRTPDWAYHQRSYLWVFLCCLLLVALFVVTLIPSRLVPPAAGLLAGGVIGNGLSAAWNDLHVPNPLVLSLGDAVVALNVADVAVLAGIGSLVAVLGVWLVRNRQRFGPAQQTGNESLPDDTTTVF